MAQRSERIPQQVLAHRLQMGHPPLHLLGHGVEIAEAPLETPLETQQMVTAFKLWDERVGAGKG